MSLQLSESNGAFKVKGALLNNNLALLENQIFKNYNPSQKIVLDLEEVTDFDSKAAYKLLKMFVRANHFNSRFSIVAMQNEIVTKVLLDTQTYSIWKNSQYIR